MTGSNTKLTHLKKELQQYELSQSTVQILFNRIEPGIDILTKKEITKLIEEIIDLIGPFEDTSRLE